MAHPAKSGLVQVQLLSQAQPFAAARRIIQKEFCSYNPPFRCGIKPLLQILFSCVLVTISDRTQHYQVLSYGEKVHNPEIQNRFPCPVVQHEYQMMKEAGLQKIFFPHQDAQTLQYTEE